MYPAARSMTVARTSRNSEGGSHLSAASAARRNSRLVFMKVTLRAVEMLTFAQPRAIGLKVSDEFTVPLCRGHHRELHQAGNEVAWWERMKIKALDTASELWEQTHPSTVQNP